MRPIFWASAMAFRPGGGPPPPPRRPPTPPDTQPRTEGAWCLHPTALATLEQALMTQRVNWVLDLDIRTFFDSVDLGWLMRMLGHRIADPRVLRLIERWLKAGVLESGRWKQIGRA